MIESVQFFLWVLVTGYLFPTVYFWSVALFADIRLGNESALSRFNWAVRFGTAIVSGLLWPIMFIKEIQTQLKK